MSITVSAVRSGAWSAISDRFCRAGPMEPKMTASFPCTVRKASLALAFAASLLGDFVDCKLCFQRRGAADVHGRRVPPVQFGNPQHPEDHRLHDQAARQISPAVAAPFWTAIWPRRSPARSPRSNRARPDFGSACGDGRRRFRGRLRQPVHSCRITDCLARTRFPFARKRYRTRGLAFIGDEGIANDQISFRHSAWF